MKIVIAPDSFKESLTAMEVAEAIEEGFREIFPDVDYLKLPVADGGEGTVQSMVDASNGRIVEKTVTGPLGTPVKAFFGLMGNGKTAVVEMAAASGLHLVPQDQRDPLVTSTFGTGELVKTALDEGVEHIIVGIGGSATNDGGLGMAQALGVRMLDDDGVELPAGGGALRSLARIDISGVDPRLAGVRLEVACDVTNPLCGPNGASHVFGPQKGASPQVAQELDGYLAHYAAVMKDQLGQDVKDVPGAGAAGGLGAAFMGLFNAVLRPGIDIVMDAVRLAEAVKDADLVITGEGRIDSQTINGKTPMGVARIAKAANKPVIGIAGCLTTDSHVVHDHGIDAIFSVVPRSVSLQEALTEAKFNVTQTARNVAAVMALSQGHS
ncbi:glycerate kinase [Pseudovibrio exalbescens]|uniref:glycerate kinase n=1 Tax=Pseudovibrio exalbescens TaxID=197461 RepID=UPI002366BF9F|nr:glycerate kinase [Pseudovibrio exalbescens]MDD7909791.1 glycerate kinase [Pseudovibrio exalbescens]